MIVAGLTGNYGMGKSYVLSVFKDLGALTLDSDSIVAGLLDEPYLIEKVIQIFGKDAVDAYKKINKQYIGQ